MSAASWPTRSASLPCRPLSIATIITDDPLYKPTDDITPRMRTVISDAKRRILPGLIKEHYQEARSAFDRNDFDVAASRFKQVMETGEVVQSDASIHKGPHPAQPPAGRLATASETGL